MFTGLIKATGNLRKRGSGVAVKVNGAFEPLVLGDSVAVDGVCLTVAEVLKTGFFADVSSETLTRTTLDSKAAKGAVVNLEPALRLSDRLGGHLVSGHIDGLGEILGVEFFDSFWKLEVCWKDTNFSRYICEKGSIALNGISLTVGGCNNEGSRFWMAIVPHTWENTALKYLGIGDLINLEADLLAKYTESLLRKNCKNHSESHSSDLTEEWLSKHGWH